MSLGKSRTEFPFRSNPLRRQQMNRRSFLKTTSTADGAAAAGSKLSTLAIGQSVQAGPTFRRPKIILPVPIARKDYPDLAPGDADHAVRGRGQLPLQPLRRNKGLAAQGLSANRDRPDGARPQSR